MNTVPTRPRETLRCDPATGQRPYDNLDKLNPEVTPNSYKSGLVGMAIGLTPPAIYLIWLWIA